MKASKIEVVRSRAKKLYTPAATMGRLQWHVRIKAGNGEIRLATETYTRKRTAVAAANFLAQIPNTVVFLVDETGD